MKDIRSTVMQLSGRWGNTCYATLCLAVEATLDLPYGDVQMKHLWRIFRSGSSKAAKTQYGGEYILQKRA